MKIQNVVASVTLPNEFDLEKIYTRFLVSAKYDPERFPGLIYHTKDQNFSMLIFKSGKMVCAGAKSAKEAKEDVYKVIKELRKGGIDVYGEPKINIVNIVASGNFRREIDMEKAVRALTKVLYEPEQFPGLIHTVDDPKSVFLVFGNGKIVCVGTKEETDLDRVVENFYLELENKNIFA